MSRGWLPLAVVTAIALGVLVGAWLFGVVASTAPTG